MEIFVRRSLQIPSLLLLGLATSPAATLVWTNTAGGPWATASNWSPNQVPTANDTVYITNNVPFTVTVAAAAVVSNLFLGSGPATVASNRFDQNAALTIHGTAWVRSNGWFRMSGTLSISNQFNNGGFFQWLDSALRGNRFVNESNAYLQTRATGTPTLGIRSFNNYGRFLQANDDTDDVVFASNAAFTNHAGGLLELDLPCFGLRNGTSVTNTLVVNEGTLNVIGGDQGCPSYLTVLFLNFGTIYLNTASIYFGAGTNYGALTASSGSRHFNTVANAPFVFEAGTTFSSPAPQIYAGGHIIFNTPVNLNSSLVHVGNASGGAATTTQSLIITEDFTLSGELEVTDGNIQIMNSNAVVRVGEVTVTSTGVLTNKAKLTTPIYRQANGSTVNTGELTVSNSFVFTGGTLRQTGGGHLTTLANSTIENTGVASRNLIGGLWENFGTVSFAFSTGLTMNGGAGWINHSNAIISANGNSLVGNTGGTNWFVNYGNWQRNGQASTPTWALVTTNYGVMTVNNTTMSFNQFYQFSGRTDLGNATVNAAQIRILGGELLGAATMGSSPSLYNAADFRPGNPRGLFTVAGPFTNAPTGVHHMEIAGTTGTTYDRVAVNGTAYLAGTLNVTFTNGFFPVLGNTFTALTWTARSGAFDQILTPNYEFEITYTPTNLLLRASNALPNVTFTVSGGNTQMVCNPFKLTATATDLDGTVTNLALLMNGDILASSPGAPLATTLEIDFPGTNLFVARAQDSRGGLAFVTQTVAQVTLPLHVLTLGGVRTNGFKVCMLGEAGANYLLYAATNVTAPFAIWSNLGPMESVNGIWRYFDANTLTNRPWRFYRALKQ